MSTTVRGGWAALAMAVSLVLAGCGTPGAPQPPSLNLPDPVTDLSAVRAGGQVTLAWTMPKRNTDKLMLKTSVEAVVCRRDGVGACEPVRGSVLLAPGAAGKFSETLPPPLASGAPRSLSYFVELKNRKGRSAGPSNAAVVLAGEAPSPVVGLNAEVRKDGIVLRWNPDSDKASVRLQRKLLTPPQAKSQPGLMARQPEPLVQNLLVEAGAREGHAIDKDIRLGETYEYRAQRVSRIQKDDKTLELAGEFCPPIRVEAKDVFPPAVPSGLVAVAVAGENGTGGAIDLSWQPDTESDLAGYFVYRLEGAGEWQRISPAQPVVGPGFHDPQVQQEHTYRYAVSAVDQGGHESARSAEAEETVPSP
jgi:hypothetical protein